MPAKVTINLKLDQAQLVKEVIREKRDELHASTKTLREHQQAFREGEKGHQDIEEKIQSHYRQVAMLSDALLEF